MEKEPTPAAVAEKPVEVKSSKEMAAFLMGDDPTPETVVETNNGGEPTTVIEPKVEGQPKPVVEPNPAGEPKSYFGGKYNDLWDSLVKKGIDINEIAPEGKLPEGTDEREFLLQAIADATEDPHSSDPIIQGYLQAKSEGKVIEFLDNARKVINFKNMTSDDGMRFYYENMTKADGTRQYTDEQVNARMESFKKMTDIEKDEIWDIRKKDIDQVINKQTETQRKIAADKWKEFLIERDAAVEDLIKKEELVTKVGGIDYTPELRQEFSKFFKDLNTLTQSGRTKFNEMLDNDSVYAEVVRAWLLTKSDTVKHYISTLKEDAKADVLTNTRLQPKAIQGAPSEKRKPPEPSDFV